MSYKHVIAALASIALCLSVRGGASARAETVDDPIVIIVSPKSPLRSIDVDELRQLYRNSSGNVDGRRVMPLNAQTGTPARRAFDQLVHSWTPAQAARYWTDRKIRGGGLPPKELASTTQIQMLVYRYPHLIGYVRASELKTTKLRALTVDGHSYWSASYPLR